MSHNGPTILFTGYAPVHFVCFRPLYEKLTQAGVEVFVSGGLRTGAGGAYVYDTPGLYEPLGLPADHILTVDEIADRDFDVLFAANTKMILPRRVGRRVQIFHGISFRNRAIRDRNADCDFYFIVGPYMHRRFVESGLITANDPRALQIGFMKTDRLLNGQLDRKALLQAYGFDGSRPVILYAPTGQRYNSLELMGLKVLASLAGAGAFDLLIKLHDHAKSPSADWPAVIGAMENDHLRLVRDLDVIRPLFLADLLITDASSVSSEYALLDRPMVFLDVPKLISKARQKSGEMVDLNTWGRRGGMVVTRPQDVLDAVRQSLAQPHMFSAIRQGMRDDLFYNPGGATQKAFQWLGSLLSFERRAIA